MKGELPRVKVDQGVLSFIVIVVFKKHVNCIIGHTRYLKLIKKFV